MNDVPLKEDVAGNLWLTNYDALGPARQHNISGQSETKVTPIEAGFDILFAWRHKRHHDTHDQVIRRH
jgi:hypothetical protein